MPSIINLLYLAILLFSISVSKTLAQCSYSGNFMTSYNCTTQKSTVTLRICDSTLPGSEFYLIGTVNGSSIVYYGTVGGPLGACPYSVTWTNVSVGTFTLRIDNTLCTSKTVAVSAPSSGTIGISASRSPFICQGESITLTGTGGSNYRWTSSNGDAWTASSITVSPSSNTTYTVTGTKSGACGGTGSASLAVGVTPTVSQVSTPQGTSARCQGSGTSTYTASASNANSYSWSITSSSGISPGTISSSGVVTWNTSFSGNATVTVTAYGCNGSTSTASKSVYVDFIPTAYNVTAISPICAGSTTTVTLSGSQQNVSYQLYKNNIEVGSVVNGTEFPIQWTGMTVGTYKVVAFPQYCSSRSMANEKTITTATAGTIQITPSRSPFLCDGESLTLTANGGSNYTWTASTGGTWYGSSITVSPSTNTTYTVTGKESICNTTDTEQITVSVTPRVSQVSITAGTPGRCQGSGTSTYTASASHATSYSWTITSSEATSPGTISASGVVTWNSSFSGNAIVTVTAYGCNGSTSIDSKAVYVDFIPTGYNVTAESPICAGSTTTVTLTGSQATVAYQLYKNGTEVGDPVMGTGTTLQWLGMTEGTYKVIAYPQYCPSRQMGLEKTITTTTPGTIYITESRPPFLCEGEGITLTAHGRSDLAYTWSSSIGESWYGVDQITVYPSSTTTYALSASEPVCNTSKSDDIQVTVKPVPNAYIDPSGEVKVGSNQTQLITAGPEGGYGEGYTYLWFKDDAILTSETQNIYLAAVPGRYKVKVTKDGCFSTSAELDLTKNILPVAAAGPDQALVLPINYLTLLGTAHDSDGFITGFQWTQKAGPPASLTSANTESLSLNDLGVGTYEFCLTATDDFPENSVEDCAIVQVSAPPNNYNRITETRVLVEGALNEADVNGLQITEEEKNVSVKYFDGLGRPMQTLSVQASPLGRDIVQPYVYDQLGRQTHNYLPVTVNQTNGYYIVNTQIIDPTTKDYTGIAANFYSDTRPFTETTFETSALDRPLKQHGAGNDWKTANKHITHQYLSNVHHLSPTAAAPGEKIVAWKLDGNGFPIRAPSHPGYIEDGYYSNGQLRIKVTSDENGNDVREYTDKAGRLVLKKVQAKPKNILTSLNDHASWALTYYVYDDFGKLRYVFQPLLSADVLKSDTYIPSSTDLNKVAFQYKYDGRQRLIEKKVPGAEPEYLVYDKFNRLVMTQDGNLRMNLEDTDRRQWKFIKYDELNRPVITGIYTHNTTVDQAGMKEEINTTNMYESYTGSSTNHGYSNTVFPNSLSNHILSVTYYDNYNFRDDLAGQSAFGYVATDIPDQEPAENANVQGQVTGSSTNILGETLAASTEYLWSITYYDETYRVVQNKTQNHKGGIDRVTNLYDFTKLRETKTSHNTATAASSSSYSAHRKFDYDHLGRLKTIWHKFHTEPDFVILQANTYNERGELETKKLHSLDQGNVYAQAIDYSYNIRGWLEKINDPSAPELGHRFSMELKYHAPSSKGGPAQFNGNISEMIWKSAGPDKQSYGYSYDQMNRLLAANYYNLTKPLNDGNYTERIGDPSGTNPRPAYDLNGNILNFIRYGKSAETPNGSLFSIVDDLAYTYAANDNMLTMVDDSEPNSNFDDGFKDDALPSDDYAYDWNGNLIRDENKGVSSIEYNVLNLPSKVTKGTEYLAYTYDAAGTKLAQKLYGSTSKITEYIDEYQYEHIDEDAPMTLILVTHEEGRIIPDNSPAAERPWEYQYFLKDHLGNVRLTFTTTEQIDADKATLEPENEIGEYGRFVRYDNVRKVRSYFFDRTNGVAPTTLVGYAQRLTGGQNEKFGLGRSISVMPGDKITAEVYAKYVDPNGNKTAELSDLLLNIAQQISSGTTDGLVRDGESFNTSTSSFPFPDEAMQNTAGSSGVGPKAYLNWLVFDRDFNFISLESGYMRLSDVPKETGLDVDHERLYSPEIQIKQAGYVYIYVSNESETPVEVYFDDFNVQHIASPVVQMDDYYPFGATFNSYTRENSIPQNFLYQEKEWQQDLSLNLYDFEWRQYDPFMGRTTTMDPHADSYHDLSPYSWAANNPVSILDPDGRNIIHTAFTTTYTGEDAQNMFSQLQSQSGTPRKLTEAQPNYSGTFSEGLSRYRNAGRQMLENVEPTGSGRIQIFGTDAPAPNPLERPVNALAWLLGNALDGALNFVSDISKNDIGLTPNPLGTVTNGVAQGFRSFSAFKRAKGAAGPGMAWHHIVEQNPSNLKRFGDESIQNLNNLLKLSHGKGSIHARISGYYSSKTYFSNGLTVRNWLKTKSFQEQYDFGIKQLKRFGWKP